MKNDKMQMSYVPQTTEHKLISANGTFDFTLPHGAIVEDVVVVKKVLDSSASSTTMNIGTTASANYYLATAHDLDTSSGAVGVASIDAAKMMETVATDRIVRLTVASLAASSAARIYVWVKYRFPENPTPTRVV
jgi:hypothetical protein